ncbi:MAG TPA: multicopper oxidase family protein [Gemmatimonadales bacterium]|nr:multicopper oxidase family protein [Gemmatimonadales bacterium]
MTAPRVTAGLFLLVVTSAEICGAQQRPCDPPTPLGPSHDLYCIELVPAPGLTGVSGRVELSEPPGPFTIAVTADGRSRYIPIFSLSGLPAGHTYVARIATPQMDSIINLGQVRNGTTALPAIDFTKFNILISEQPSGRYVLRGQSPSTRLFPPDLLEFSVGAMGAAGSQQAETMAHHPHAAGWPMVPAPAQITMLPAEMRLRPPPDVTPFLPSDTVASPAQPSRRIELKDGDTLRLEAGVVTRALKGDTCTMYAFNGQYPGPLLEVPRGAEIAVLFTNKLPDSTAIHWHGIRLDNSFDGVPGLTQPAIPPGGSFTYRVRFPDAGIYWYHPHVREDVQQELGLYGDILVRPSASSRLSGTARPARSAEERGRGGEANREAILMLDDLLIGDAGLSPLGKESPTHALMGRFGNVFLVNGEPDYRLTVARGEIIRFYLTNASNTRTWNLSFAGGGGGGGGAGGGGNARMKVVASDAGPFEHEAWVQSIVIGPAERYVVDVRFDKAGTVAFLNRVQGLDHLYGRFFSEVDTLGTITVTRRPVTPDYGARFAKLRSDSATIRELEPLRRYVEAPPDKVLVLTLETHDLPFVTQRLMTLDSIYFAPVEWSGTMPMMNWTSTGKQVRWILRDPATGEENTAVDWHFKRGSLVKIRLVNERRAFHGMQHPIHLHGQRFLVLAVNGVPSDNLVWKDTVLVPAGSVVDILLDASNPGRWMLHCHIAEHLSAGMMTHFTVE